MSSPDPKKTERTPTDPVPDRTEAPEVPPGDVLDRQAEEPEEG